MMIHNLIVLFNTPQIQLTTMQKYQITFIEFLIFMPFVIIGVSTYVFWLYKNKDS